MADIERVLSLRLYDVLEKVGASEKIRKVYQETVVTKEIISTICYTLRLSNIGISEYRFGSSCEGTTTVGLHSDIDLVYCSDCFPVITDINTAPPGNSLLMVRENETYPGYVKLQCIVNGIPQTILNSTEHNSVRADSTERRFYKHVHYNLPGFERHGPAESTKEGEIKKSIDRVIAYRCKTIPLFVREWLRRHRSNSWPSCDDLHRMRELGCFVVGVGHCTSREADIEWRLSFSLQERLLMFGLNPTQHKCYVMLKILKKEVIQQQIGESISSYHCKTCMFYAIENTKAELWKPRNLITCVRVCLLTLLTWVCNGNCPNYFVPLENMFERPHFREIKENLIQVLRLLVSDCPSFISRLQCDNVGQMIRAPTNEIQTAQFPLFERYVDLFQSINEFSHQRYKYSFKIKDPLEGCLRCSTQIEWLRNTRCITVHTEQQTRDAISLVMPVLRLQLAQRLISFALISEDHARVEQILRLNLHHLREGRIFDFMTSRLLYASLLIRRQNYELCETILKDIENSLNIHVMSHCECGDTGHNGTQDLIRIVNDCNISPKQFAESCAVTCVKFLPCDIDIIPIPLRAEMFRSDDTLPGSRDELNEHWFDWAVVDAKVYLYFLQYLVFSRLNKHEHIDHAIVNLNLVLGRDTNLGHKETGYNLLGWMFAQEGRHHDAFSQFMTSWAIRPFHNAAKFHLRKLVHDITS